MISKALVLAAYHCKLRELAKCGIELTLAVPGCWGAQQLESIKPKAYDMVVMNCRFSRSHHFHYYPDIDAILGKRHWDLIHIDEEPFNFVTYHAMRADNRKATKVVFFTWQNIMKRYPPPFNCFEKYVFEGASGAIAGNREAYEILRHRGFSKYAVMIPQFGVDVQAFRPREAKQLRSDLNLEGEFVVGFVGRIVPEKGLKTLIHAFASLSRECRLVLQGSGPYRAKLEAMIARLGLSKRVSWIPWVLSSDIPKYMNALDVLVLPSLTCANWKEQFGRVLVEAMACGVCVVGSDSGEIPSVIGDAGLVFPEGNYGELVNCLRRLMRDPSLREELRERGRARVMERFTHERIARDTVTFYEQVHAVA